MLATPRTARRAHLALPLALRLSLLALGLFALLIQGGGMLSQDFSDSQAFESLFMTSSVCDPNPCLMGIQAGMPVTEAVALLRQHPWVEYVSVPSIGDPSYFDYEGRVHWRWNGQQPAIVNANRPGYLLMDASTDRVYQIEVETHLRFGAITQEPSKRWARHALFWPDRNRINYAVSYRVNPTDAWIVLTTEIPCPAQLLQYVDLTHTLVSQNIVAPHRIDTSPARLAAMCRAATFGY
jgi:hypothetical protein